MSFLARLAVVILALASIYLLLLGMPIAAMLDGADRLARWAVRQWAFWMEPLKWMATGKNATTEAAKRWR